MGRRIVVFAVGNAEAATQVHMTDGVPVGAQGTHEIGQQRKSVVERLELCDLAADMHVHAGDFEAWEFCRAGINVTRAADRNSELVFGLAGRDFGVGFGVDVGIDANRDTGRAALALGDG